jgi:ubiquitin carboxyl-terminal hydrolase 7
LTDIEADPTKEGTLPVLHFHKDAVRVHSVPFLFKLRADDTVADVKARLQQRLGMNDKDWQKVKVALLHRYNSMSPGVTYITDETVVVSQLPLELEDALGLDYPDPKWSTNKFAEKGIKILT